MTHRVFFALAPGRDVRDRLTAAIDALEAPHADRLRWLGSGNWHVTLRFVGNVAQSTVDALLGCLDQSAGHESFELELAQIEPFPSRTRPLVLAATGEAPTAAGALIRDLEHCCRNLGLAPETRPWRPHLTLARIRGRRRFEMEPLAISVAFRASRLQLMESVAAERGRNYVPLAEVTLV